MPGWMGLRGLVTRTVHDMDRERRDDQRAAQADGRERRANEKVQEILRNQQGDMSAFTGGEDLEEDAAVIRTLPVDKIMSTKVAVLTFDDNLMTVQGIFSSVKFRHLPIVDDNGAIIGIVSDRDCLRMASPFFGTINEQNRDKEIMTRKVGTVMTRNPVCATLETRVLDAIRMMNERKISCLPVVHRETRKLLGIITWKDIVRAFCPDGFNRARDSQRLKEGVRLNPATTESARIRAKAEESSRLRKKMSYEEEVQSAAERLAARIRAAREEEDKHVIGEQSSPEGAPEGWVGPAKRLRNTTRHFQREQQPGPEGAEQREAPRRDSDRSRPARGDDPHATQSGRFRPVADLDDSEE